MRDIRFDRFFANLSKNGLETLQKKETKAQVSICSPSLRETIQVSAAEILKS